MLLYIWNVYLIHRNLRTIQKGKQHYKKTIVVIYQVESGERCEVGEKFWTDASNSVALDFNLFNVGRIDEKVFWDICQRFLQNVKHF